MKSIYMYLLSSHGIGLCVYLYFFRSLGSGLTILLLLEVLFLPSILYAIYLVKNKGHFSEQFLNLRTLGVKLYSLNFPTAVFLSIFLASFAAVSLSFPFFFLTLPQAKPIDWKIIALFFAMGAVLFGLTALFYIHNAGSLGISGDSIYFENIFQQKRIRLSEITHFQEGISLGFANLHIYDRYKQRISINSSAKDFSSIYQTLYSKYLQQLSQRKNELPKTFALPPKFYQKILISAMTMQALVGVLLICLFYFGQPVDAIIFIELFFLSLAALVCVATLNPLQPQSITFAKKEVVLRYFLRSPKAYRISRPPQLEKVQEMYNGKATEIVKLTFARKKKVRVSGTRIWEFGYYTDRFMQEIDELYN
ncbi:MAG: hypothetical protein AAF518_19500 [Spirochaetota bacterium]